jgi:predicted ATPase
VKLALRPVRDQVVAAESALHLVEQGAEDKATGEARDRIVHAAKCSRRWCTKPCRQVIEHGRMPMPVAARPRPGILSAMGKRAVRGSSEAPPFLLRLQLVRERIANADQYPFSIPAVAAADGLSLHPHVTYFVGENGSGKSTLLEAIAIAAGFNPEGGSMNFRFSTRSSESSLAGALRLVRSVRRPRTGFFLRAESFFNVATTIEELGPQIMASYGGRSLHEQSHGESFIALALHRFGPDGLYMLDEPEAALSPLRQMSMLRRMHDLVREGCQFIVATHAPILLAYPQAWIYQLDEHGLQRVAYDDTSTVRVTRDFLDDRDRTLDELFSEDP